MAIEKDVRAGPVVLVGIVSAILVFAVIVGLTALFLRAQQREAYNKAQSQGPGELRRLRSEQLQVLGEYRWQDPEKGIVAVPVERAMELLVREAVNEDGSGRER
jgi:hypothetical protein